MMRRLLIFVLLVGSAWGTACPGGYTNNYAISINPQILRTTDQSNFPMLFLGSTHLATTGNGGNALLTTGVDIIFCDAPSAGNLLNFELVANTYSQTTGAGEWWVNVPTVSHTIVKTIYVFVGNASGTNQSNAAGVWSAYLGVWHFGTSGSLAVTDSTGINTPVNHGATATAGQIDGGAAMASGSSQYIDTGGHLQPTGSQISVLAWVNTTNCASNTRVVSNADASFVNGYEIYINSSCKPLFQAVSASAFTSVTSPFAIPTGTWEFVAATQNGTGATTQHMYINGKDVLASQSGTGGIGTASVNMNLGRWTGGASNFFNGVVDEIEFYNGVLTADWIATVYSNQTNATCFYSVSGAPNTCFAPVLDQLPSAIQTNECPGQTCAYGQNVVSGNTLIVSAQSDHLVTGISDTCGSSWGSPVDSNTTSTAFAYAWVAAAACSGADTVTITGTLGFTMMTTLEMPAVVGTTVDVHGNGAFTNGPNLVPTGSITTTTNGDFIYGMIAGSASGGVFQPFVPLQIVQQPNGSGSGAAAYGFAQQNGSYNILWNNNPETVGGYVLFALKPSAIAIKTTSLPSAALTNAYQYCLQAVGGAGTYTWSVSSGSLPTGLTINSSTGCVTGTATGPTTTPTFQVTDGTHTTTAALTLTVNSSAGSITLVSSNHAAATSTSLSSVAVGNLLVFWEVNSVVLSPPTDTCSTVYKYLGAYNSPSTEWTVSLYAGLAINTGTCTITSNANSAPIAVGAVQYHNVQAFYDTLTWSGAVGTSSANAVGPNVATYSPNSIILAAMAPVTAGTTIGAVAPFTLQVIGSGTAEEDNIESAAGVYIPSFTQSGNSNGSWVIGSMSLRPTTSGAVNTNHRRAWVISQP